MSESIRSCNMTINNINKIKQEDIAKELGVTPATITYYKNKIK